MTVEIAVVLVSWWWRATGVTPMTATIAICPIAAAMTGRSGTRDRQDWRRRSRRRLRDRVGATTARSLGSGRAPARTANAPRAPRPGRSATERPRRRTTCSSAHALTAAIRNGLPTAPIVLTASTIPTARPRRCAGRTCRRPPPRRVRAAEPGPKTTAPASRIGERLAAVPSAHAARSSQEQVGGEQPGRRPRRSIARPNTNAPPAAERKYTPFITPAELSGPDLDDRDAPDDQEDRERDRRRGRGNTRGGSCCAGRAGHARPAGHRRPRRGRSPRSEELPRELRVRHVLAEVTSAGSTPRPPGRARPPPDPAATGPGPSGPGRTWRRRGARRTRPHLVEERQQLVVRGDGAELRRTIPRRRLGPDGDAEPRPGAVHECVASTAIEFVSSPAGRRFSSSADRPSTAPRRSDNAVLRISAAASTVGSDTAVR